MVLGNPAESLGGREGKDGLGGMHSAKSGLVPDFEMTSGASRGFNRTLRSLGRRAETGLFLGKKQTVLIL